VDIDPTMPKRIRFERK